MGLMQHVVPAVAASLTLAGCGAAAGDGGAAHAAAGGSFAALAGKALAMLERGYYTGAGTWNMCLPARCRPGNTDWGADALTYSLYLHWQVSRDRAAAPIMTALARTAFTYGPAVNGWSDGPLWDSVADLREYQVTGDQAALSKAKAAFAQVDSVRTASYATGACPRIDYQMPGGGTTRLKTLETDSNYIKAAVLLYQVTADRAYLAKAERKYAAVRAYFLSPVVPLYTVYVFDSGTRCRPLPGQYFASVNGNMIWAGAELARITGTGAYLAEAVATARAVSRYLADGAGVYADLQAENDVGEPLVEAMYLLAAAGQERFARAWLLRCASAAAAAMTASGASGRFFDGPPPRTLTTAWEVNGGIALMIAAAALDPGGVPPSPGYWRRAVFVSHNARLPEGGGMVRLTFTGRAIAIIGTIGERCCYAGHALVFVDGTQTFDHTGIWQNKSSSGQVITGAVLFAWRWPAAGRHTIAIGPGAWNPKQGGPYFHMTGYYLVR